MILAILAACSGKVDKSEPVNDQEILDQISAYKQRIKALNDSIADLEKQLSTSGESGNGVAVATSVVQPETFHHYIEVNGVAEAVNSAYISPEINGQIKEIYVVEGQKVNKGDKLIKINSSVTENSINEVKTNLDLAKTVYKKQKELWDKNIGSEMDYLRAKNNVESLESRLETLNSQLDMALIKAPINGVIDEVRVKKGEMAIPGVQMIQMVNLDEMYINADVSEAYIQNVSEGEMVLLEFPSFPDISMEVPVYRTGNVIKSANRTFEVQLKIKNQDRRIKPNLLAKIKINDYTRENAIVVPSIIVKEDMKGFYLYVVDQQDNAAKKVYVETGKSYNDKTIIIDGLKGGDEVIVNGYNQVSTGTKLKITA